MSILLRGPAHGHGPGPTAILVEEGVISRLGPATESLRGDTEIVAEEGELIAPGFIDLQVNGVGGIDAACGRDAISAISELLPRFGVTGYLPTAISCPLSQARSFVEAAREAHAPGARVLGAHLEGPFLNPAFRGAHDPQALVLPTPANVDLLLSAPPRMMTLAPELPDGLQAVARLWAAGTLVAAGHSGADFDCGVRAIAAGVRFGTHLYNAMRAFHHRRPGLCGALLMDRRVAVGLIADGQHLHDATIAQAVQLKSPARVALTTDQTAAAGAAAGRYQLGGRVDEMVRRVAALPGLGPEEAITMASRSPAEVLGERRLGRLEAGAAADLVLLDRDRRPRLTLVGGEVRFSR
ncbi:MAG: N-acetylglucosamine-6-phosphate deacetylase [Chloroflexi bacterium]|nr:MAG: N-acetylglucosamine-6-phosphate deacetylase [Chloroflexota bacterium]